MSETSWQICKTIQVGYVLVEISRNQDKSDLYTYRVNWCNPVKQKRGPWFHYHGSSYLADMTSAISQAEEWICNAFA